MTTRNTHFAFFSGLILCACILYSCATSMPVPTAAHAQWASQRWPGTDTTALQHGRTLYIDNCARCHNLYLPGAFTEKEWVDIMPKMKKKARITDSEADSILRYVLSSAAIQPLPVQQTIKTEQ